MSRSEIKRILVCGGRDFNDQNAVWGALDKTLEKYPSMMLIHGACETGADHIAELWAKTRQVPYWGFPARWDKFKNAAGPLRNREMRDIAKPDACIAFKGGAGTSGMIALMREIGIEPWLIGW